MISIEIEFPDGDIEFIVKGHITEAMDDSGRSLENYLRSNAPQDLGDHSRVYRVEPFQFRGDELTGALANDVANSLYRERGRPPGRMPPVKALEGWANRRGIPAYLVARKIGLEGTERWIANENPLGIDRASQPGNIIVNPDSIVIEKLNEGITAANDFTF